MSGPLARYGPGFENLYAGSPLNRMGFLRENYAFLNQAFKHPQTRFIPLLNQNPFTLNAPADQVRGKVYNDNALIGGVRTGSNPKHPPRHRLGTLSYDQIKHIAGDPFYADEQTVIDNWSSTRDRAGVNNAQVVFLGLDESRSGLEFSTKENTYKGQAWFAVNVTPMAHSSEKLKQDLEQLVEQQRKDTEADEGDYRSVRLGGAALSNSEYAVYAQASMFIDWNNRNKFCGGCGRPLMSINGGCKLTCPPKDNGVETGECETRGRITNLSFPRTDSCTIVAVVSSDGKKLLLGRSSRFPTKMYSCLAGFLEPGEGLEECVRREVWEEAGVTVGRVVLHSSQPWPYPANLMIGCIAEAVEGGEEINTSHDGELADARWFPMEEVIKTLNKEHDEIFIPPKEAIAHVLIRAAATGTYLSMEQEQLDAKL
uniref:NAD(+) diphosphatase n=1 Tax=Blastobotrys adeninivorans TaxID=409370 RepID=A0A060TAZ8_BLAAD